jgi:bacterioferritin (cytochrome b1)
MSARLVSPFVVAVFARVRGRIRLARVTVDAAASRPTVLQLLEAELAAERRAIAAHRELIGFIGDQDPEISATLAVVVATKQERADELGALLQTFPGSA